MAEVPRARSRLLLPTSPPMMRSSAASDAHVLPQRSAWDVRPHRPSVTVRVEREPGIPHRRTVTASITSRAPCAHWDTMAAAHPAGCPQCSPRWPLGWTRRHVRGILLSPEREHGLPAAHIAARLTGQAKEADQMESAERPTNRILSGGSRISHGGNGDAMRHL
jgi:hypothetical protein